MAAPRKKKEEAGVEGGGENASLIAKLVEKHGSMIQMGKVDLNVRKTATGIWTLDNALAGGFPMAKIIEIHGAAGSGKTSLACLTGAALQRKYPDRYVVYIDAESALDEVLAMEIYGLDPTRTYIVRPDISVTAETIMDVLVDAAMNPAVCAVFLDSVAGLVTAAEMAKDGAGILVAPIATLLGRTVKKLNSRQDPEAAPVFLLNQIRHAIGNAGITTPGGSAVEFYPSLRLRLRRGDPVKNGEEEVGFTCRCQIVKARYSRNRIITSWSVIYGDEGISTLRAIITVALDQKLVIKSGSWFAIEGIEGKKWQGMENMLAYLRDNPEAVEFLKDNLRVEYTADE